MILIVVMIVIIIDGVFAQGPQTPYTSPYGPLSSRSRDNTLNF